MQLTDIRLHDVKAVISPLKPTSYISIPQTPGSSPHKTRQDRLLRYLFHPTPVDYADGMYSDISSLEVCKSGHCDLWEEQAGRVWMEPPSEAQLELDDRPAYSLVAYRIV